MSVDAEFDVEDLIARITEGFASSNQKEHKADLEKLSKKNWAVNSLIAVVVGSSGVVAAYQATDNRSKNNAEDLQQHVSQPIHPQSESRIQKIEKSIGTTKSTIERVEARQEKLIIGVEKLTIEAQSREERRMKDKIRRLESENRQLNRGLRRRPDRD